MKKLLVPVALAVVLTSKCAFGAGLFSINVNFTGSAEHELLFTNAARAWESRITGYRGVMSYSAVTINAVVAPIDGVGGVLGSAGPTSVTIQDEDGVAGGNVFLLTSAGNMTFDESDAAALSPSVIEHEMAHVLGFGTLWSAAGVSLAGEGRQELYTADSGQFTGAAATAQWQEEFGQGNAYVPVELGGGSGTANGHWNEVENGAGPTGIVQTVTGNDIRDELMTGWLNEPAYVSLTTLASFYDIGYTLAPPVSVSVAAVPEPSSLVLLSLGGLALMHRRRSF